MEFCWIELSLCFKISHSWLTNDTALVPPSTLHPASSAVRLAMARQQKA
jgi:hypothetical protein